MRNGQNKRMRGRNRSKGQNPLTRVYESNGPDVKIRGTANHVAEKYVQLARDAQSSGDHVAAENYFQHAEHYFRLIAAVQEQFRQNNPYAREGDMGYDDSDDEGGDQPIVSGEPYAPREHNQPYQQRESQPYQQRDNQQRENQPRDNQQRENQPRDNQQRENQPRDNQQRENQPRDNQQRENRYPPREQHQASREQAQPYPPRQQTPGASEGDESGDIGLPAFVTGGGAPNGGPPIAYSGNGHEGGGGPDRFPLHRRRRRRHGAPRSEGQAGGEAGDQPPDSRPSGE